MEGCVPASCLPAFHTPHPVCLTIHSLDGSLGLVGGPQMISDLAIDVLSKNVVKIVFFFVVRMVLVTRSVPYITRCFPCARRVVVSPLPSPNRARSRFCQEFAAYKNQGRAGYCFKQFDKKHVEFLYLVPPALAPQVRRVK